MASCDQPRQHINKQRHYFASKVPSSQGYGFSSCHVWMWEPDYKESWVLKNWCFWTVVLEKSLESLLDFKEIQPVHPQGHQSWVFFERTGVETETPVLWSPDVKSWLSWKYPEAGKDWGQEEKGTTEDDMDMASGGLRQLVMNKEVWCAVVHGVTKSWTRLSDWTELNTVSFWVCHIFYIELLIQRGCQFEDGISSEQPQISLRSSKYRR